MIRINLLPPDLRKREGAPVRRLAVVAAGAVLVTSSLMLVLSIHFRMLQKALAEEHQVQGRFSMVAPEAKYADALDREEAEYRKRNETIQEISASRLLWTKKLDQLFDIIQYGEETDRHFVWLTNLKVTPGRTLKGKKTDGGTLEIKGFSATEALDKFSDFHKDLKDSPFFEDFASIDDPSGRVVTFKEDVQPKKAWDFQLTMNLKPVEARRHGNAKHAASAQEK